MAEPKTRPTRASVTAFLDRIEDSERRNDCYAVMRMMQALTGAKPAMWGSSIVGFGNAPYAYASGREGDWPVAAFSPRAQNLTIYLLPGFDRHPGLEKLGKHSTGKSCLYIKRLSDVHLPTLRVLIQDSLERRIGAIRRKAAGSTTRGKRRSR